MHAPVGAVGARPSVVPPTLATMGSDPRRLDGLRADEQVAAVLVERATGATARAHDVGTRQGAHDVDLVYPGGRTAALEVTTHAGSGARQAPALLGRERATWPNPGRWSWTVGIGDSRDIPRLRALYRRAITACEAHGVTTVAGLPDAVLALDPELRWVASTSTSTVVGRPTASGTGARPVASSSCRPPRPRRPTPTSSASPAR